MAQTRKVRHGGTTWFVGARPWALMIFTLLLLLLLQAQVPSGEAVRLSAIERNYLTTMLRGGRVLLSLENYVDQIEKFKVDSHAIDDSEDDIQEPRPDYDFFQTMDENSPYIVEGDEELADQK